MKQTSKTNTLRGVAAACGVAAITMGPAVAAPVTFAQFIQQNGALQAWSITTSGNSTTVTASAPVLFSFSGLSGLPFSGPESARFSLTATTSQSGNCGVSCGPGDSYVQPGYAGMFSFTDTGSAPGANLLSGVFAVTGSPSTTGAQFSSSIGGTGGSFNASTTPGNLSQLVLTSTYLSFLTNTDETASFSLSSLIPSFSTGLVSGSSAYPAAGPFGASGTGTFSSNPGPVARVVPEPSTMGMMGTGLLGLGLLLGWTGLRPQPRVSRRADRSGRVGAPV